MALRLRLTLWYTVVLATSLAVFGLLLYLPLDRMADAEVESSLAEKAEDVARGLRLRGELSFLPRRATLPRTASLTALTFSVQLLDPSGRIVDRSDNLVDVSLPVPPDSLAAGQAGEPSYDTVFLAGQEIRLYTVPVQVGESLVGFIQVGRSVNTYNRTLDWLAKLLVGIGAAMLVVASGVGYLLARAALSPINRVTQAARAIGLSQKLDRRLQPYPHRDEVGQLISTFNEMLDRLDSAFAAQRRFVSDASHELRTPLTTIRGNVAFLRREGLDPAERLAALEDIAGEAERMSRLITSLLALARADAGRHLERKLVSVDTALLDVYRQAQVLGAGLRVRLGPVEPAEALADADALRQMLLVLVENAVKYNRPGGEVWLTLTRDGAWLRLTVGDTGIGMSPEETAQAFERFYRAPAARRQDGTGLGLAIARWIAEEHEGRITVESAPGQGSTFTVLLPSVHAPARVGMPVSSSL